MSAPSSPAQTSPAQMSFTGRYSVHQFLYWAGVGGVVSFSATYLIAKGFSAAYVGWILFSAYVLSFLLQPAVASFADRARKNVLPALTLCLTGFSVFCFVMIRFARLPVAFFSVLYAAGVMALDMCIPMMNSIAVYYTRRNWTVNYGLGRGMGGFGFAVATLLYGFIMEDLGGDWLMNVAIVFLIASGVMVLFYPKIPDQPVENASSLSASSTLGSFLKKYRWYCASLFGVLFLAMMHAMVENYLIEVFRTVGGDSSNVGIALFIATVIELPAMTFFPKIRNKLGSRKVLLIAGLSYTLRGVLYVLAGSVTAIYVSQLLQCVTYVFLSAVQMYYADECTSPEDMVKGQSLITAFYTLGCAIGNLLGGIIISASGVRTMLYAGVAMAVTGFIVLFVTLSRALSCGNAAKQK